MELGHSIQGKVGRIRSGDQRTYGGSEPTGHGGPKVRSLALNLSEPGSGRQSWVDDDI